MKTGNEEITKLGTRVESDIYMNKSYVMRVSLNLQHVQTLISLTNQEKDDQRHEFFIKQDSSCELHTGCEWVTSQVWLSEKMQTKRFLIWCNPTLPLKHQSEVLRLHSALLCRSYTETLEVGFSQKLCAACAGLPWLEDLAQVQCRLILHTSMQFTRSESFGLFCKSIRVRVQLTWVWWELICGWLLTAVQYNLSVWLLSSSVMV